MALQKEDVPCQMDLDQPTSASLYCQKTAQFFMSCVFIACRWRFSQTVWLASRRISVPGIWQETAKKASMGKRNKKNQKNPNTKLKWNQQKHMELWVIHCNAQYYISKQGELPFRNSKCIKHYLRRGKTLKIKSREWKDESCNRLRRKDMQAIITKEWREG